MHANELNRNNPNGAAPMAHKRVGPAVGVMSKPFTLAVDRLIGRVQLEQIVGWRPGVAAMRDARGLSMPSRYKIGRAVRYRDSDVAAWLDAQRVAVPVTSSLASK